MKEGKEAIIGICKDLGMAAYLKMLGFTLKTRRGREFEFILEENELEKFENEKINYLHTAFCTFDSEIMNLKKI